MFCSGFYFWWFSMKAVNYVDDIIKGVGGVDNIKDVVHCSTRLRFDLVDYNKTNIDMIKLLPDVVDAFYRAGQFQIIIGSHVLFVFSKLKKIINSNNKNHHNNVESNLNVFDKFISTVVSIFQPIVPAIFGAGMLKAFLILLVAVGCVDKTDQIYILFNIISDSAYYFLPMLLALSCSKKFETNSFISIALAGVLVHPKLIDLLSSNIPLNIAGLSIPSVKYSFSVIPIILTIWLMSYVERCCDRFISGSIAILFKPVIVLIVVSPISLFMCGPVGNSIGIYIANIIIFIQENFGFISNALLALSMPIFVMFGMHKIFYPIVFSAIATVGYDSLILSSMFASNIAQGAGALTVWFLTNNMATKQIALPAGVSALFGISEPALYGVHLKTKKSLFCCMFGALCAGFFSGLVSLKSFTNIVPGLLTLPMFYDEKNNFKFAIITLLISFFVTVISIIVVNLKTGFVNQNQDIAKRDVNEDIPSIIEKSIHNKRVIFSPVYGNLSKNNKLDTMEPDENKSINILLNKGNIMAPFDGVIVSCSDEFDYIKIRSHDGIELILSITVSSKNISLSEYATRLCFSNQFNQGDRIFFYDVDLIKENGSDIFASISLGDGFDYFDVIWRDDLSNISPAKPLMTLL